MKYYSKNDFMTYAARKAEEVREMNQKNWEAAHKGQDELDIDIEDAKRGYDDVEDIVDQAVDVFCHREMREGKLLAKDYDARAKEIREEVEKRLSK